MADDYQIIAQRQTTEVVGAGQIQDVWEVTVSVPEAAATLIIRVPLSDASPAAVDAAIRPRVDAAKAIAAL